MTKHKHTLQYGIHLRQQLHYNLIYEIIINSVNCVHCDITTIRSPRREYSQLSQSYNYVICFITFCDKQISCLFVFYLND